METDYPWQGQVRLRVRESDAGPWDLSLRVPDWCPAATVSVNGKLFEGAEMEKGYLNLNRSWQAGDVIQLELAMAPILIEPNPRVDATRGCLAIQRGPVVYCLEAQDQVKGVDLLDVSLEAEAPLQTRWAGDLLGGVMLIEAEGFAVDSKIWSGKLYRPWSGSSHPAEDRIRLLAVPYFAWGNRGLKSMRVWIPRAR
jgi:DUF1680 family protein